LVNENIDSDMAKSILNEYRLKINTFDPNLLISLFDLDNDVLDKSINNDLSVILASWNKVRLLNYGVYMNFVQIFFFLQFAQRFNGIDKVIQENLQVILNDFFR